MIMSSDKMCFYIALTHQNKFKQTKKKRCKIQLIFLKDLFKVTVLNLRQQHFPLFLNSVALLNNCLVE